MRRLSAARTRAPTVITAITHQNQLLIAGLEGARSPSLEEARRPSEVALDADVLAEQHAVHADSELWVTRCLLGIDERGATAERYAEKRSDLPFGRRRPWQGEQKRKRHQTQ